MVKGCQRKTIHIKDTGSKYYEEAYLILRPGAFEKEGESVEMIDEAMRIVGESIPCEKYAKRKNISFNSMLCFVLGIAAGAVITFFIGYILRGGL